MPATNALIIGAGIGGLAAGIALRRAGLDVEVYERADELRDVGAGISLWANAIHALTELGLGDAVRSAGAPYAIAGLRSSRGGLLASVSSVELERKLGVPVIVMHRADLLAMLLDAFGMEHVHLGSRCVGFHQDAAVVTGSFAGGRHARGDILVGADGLHSVVRSELHGNQPPRYAGCTAWRAVVPFDGAVVQAAETWGHGQVFGAVPISGNRVYWYATKNRPEGQQVAHHRTELLRLFRGWHTPVEALIEAADEGAILRNDIYDRPVLKKWGRGRVTLLGDAAHPMTPYLGQGGCQAIEDAIALAKCLRESGDVTLALQAYESRRIPRANAIVSRSRQVGRIAQLQQPVAVFFRNLALKLVTPGMQASQLARIAGRHAQ